MESCFVTSNYSSLTKTIELVVPNPVLKANAFISNYHKKGCISTTANSFQYCKRAGHLPSFVTRCHLSQPSPSDDNNQHVLDADWRSFRARLVASERASPRITEPHPLVLDLDRVVDHDDSPPPQVIIGDKWAHKIHEPEKGCLLIATDKLDGVHIFERTIVLLLSTGPVGSFGVILNRPSLMSIKELRSTALETSGPGLFSERALFFGGPLEEGLFLVSPTRGYDDDDMVSKSEVFEEIMKGVYYGTKESLGCASEMVKRNVVGVSDFRFFDGYCGWEREQLREEINSGYWTVAACSPSVIRLGSSSSESARGLWDEVVGLMGPKIVW